MTGIVTKPRPRHSKCIMIRLTEREAAVIARAAGSTPLAIFARVWLLAVMQQRGLDPNHSTADCWHAQTCAKHGPVKP